MLKLEAALAPATAPASLTTPLEEAQRAQMLEVPFFWMNGLVGWEVGEVLLENFWRALFLMDGLVGGCC